MPIDRNEFSEREGPQFIAELSRVDQKFGVYMRKLGWDAAPRQWEAQAAETVREYISVMKDHKDELTPENLLSRKVQLSGNVDPVFTVLLRAIAGPKVMTPDVFDKIRDSWCHFDLPSEVDEIIRIQDDSSFVRHFSEVRLNAQDNVKLLALQRLGIVGDLVRQSQGQPLEA